MTSLEGKKQLAGGGEEKRALRGKDCVWTQLRERNLESLGGNVIVTRRGGRFTQKKKSYSKNGGLEGKRRR